MFLERIAELQLLNHDPESDVLGSFPLDVKCQMISQMNKYLLSAEGEPSEVLTSPNHVKFAMELVGQGLDLPLYNISIISSSITVYANWLLEPKKRPLIMLELGESSIEFQNHIQDIFKHLSMVFRPRIISEGSHQQGLPNLGPTTKQKDHFDDYISFFNQHIELCDRVLTQHILTTVKLHSSHFTQETWIVLLKVMLGICDTLLTQPLSRSTAPVPSSAAPGKYPEFHDREHVIGIMGDKLCEPLIKTIFQVWILSKTDRVDLWDKFKEYFMSWNFRVQMIQEWCSVSLNLSLKVIQDLQIKTPSIRSLSMPGIIESKSEESIEISKNIMVMSADPEAINLEFSKSPSYYCWHRTIYMMQNPVYLEPLNFQTAIQGISKLVDEFILFGRRNESALLDSPINGNTILNMFSAWLFPAAAMFKSGYEAGRAQAITCLCKIFSQPQRIAPFHRQYLDKFYQIISNGLGGDFLSLCAVIRNSEQLFSAGLEGIRLLTPFYIKGLSKILPNVQIGSHDLANSHKMDLDELRKDGYRILAATACSINPLSNIPIEMPICDIVINRYVEPQVQAWIDSMYPVQEITTFSSLKPLITSLFVNSLVAESNPSNYTYLLQIISSYITQEYKVTHLIFNVFIKVIQELVLIPDLWSAPVMLTAFNFLGYISTIISTENEGWEECARDVTTTLCQYINNNLKPENVVPLQLRLIRAFDLIARWSLVGNWLIKDHASQRFVISSLSRGVVWLDRENAYSQSSLSTPGEPPVSKTHSAISHNTLAALGKLSESLKADPSLSASQHASSGSFTSSAALKSSKKPQASISLAPTKRFGKLRISYSPSGGNLITAPKDAGVGLPTFAVVSAEIQIKTAADRAMQLITLRLGNFPSNGSCFGVTKLYSGWKELNKCVEMYKIQAKLLNSSDAKYMFPEDYKLIHYFSFQKTTIFGMVELPNWRSDLVSEPAPTLALISLNSEGKFSWLLNFKYKEHSKNENLGSMESLFGVAIDHKEIFEKWNSILANMPNSTTDAIQNTILKVESVNESNIPLIDDLQNLPGLDESLLILDKIEEHQKLENYVFEEEKSNSNYNATGKKPVQVNDPSHIPKHFRLLLSTLGFLDHQAVGSLAHLPVTGSLLQDLEKLDETPSRDSFLIDVYYFKSAQEIPENSARAGDMMSSDFETFLWTLGWPVDVNNHSGYLGPKGTLKDYSIVPYFSNSHTEIIFKVPYLCKKDSFRSASLLKIGHSKSASSLGSSNSSIGNQPNLDGTGENSRLNFGLIKPRQRSLTSNPTKSTEPEKESWILEAETVGIIWLEDVHNISQLINQLPAHIFSCVVVHPLRDLVGLYQVRILSKPGVIEDCLTAGPLVDEMIVGDYNLGSLARHTATNIIKIFQISKNLYRRPHLTRRQFIEDIITKHSTSNNGIYTDLFCK